MTKRKVKSVRVRKESEAFKKKVENVSKILKIASSYPNIVVVNIRNLPDRILQKSKKSLRGKAEIVVAKNSTIIRALNSVENGKILAEHIKSPTALVFTTMTPYQIFKFFKENKTKVAAKPGQVAPFDIVVPEGETDLPPGPALSELKSAGINAQIKGGKIVVAKDSVVAKKGSKISENVCKALQKLGILPFETMVDVVAAYDGKLLYTSPVLDVDEAKLHAELSECVLQAVNLSSNASYPTQQNISLLLSNALAHARSLAANSGFYSDATIGALLSNAAILGEALSSKVLIDEQSNASAGASTAGAPSSSNNK